MTALPTLTVEVGFTQSANTGAWTLGTSALGTGTVLGEALIYDYVDVADDIREIRVKRGKMRQQDVYQAGTLTVRLDNRSRDYDPLNLAGPYVTGGVTDVKPGRPVRVYMTHPVTGIVYDVFRGRIRTWDLDYTGKFDAVATFTATDALTELANAEVDLTTTPGQTSDAAAEVLAAADVTQFSVEEGASSAQAMTFAGNALAALRVLETSEQGAVYGEANGDIVFASRHALISNPRSRYSQATFGAGTLDYHKIDIAYESDLIKNQVTATRVGGVAQTATNQDSIDDYGRKSLTLTGLANGTDDEVEDLAAYIVGKYGELYVRIKGIELTPCRNDSLMTQALSRRIRDRVTVEFTPVGGGSIISQEVFITGIEHEINQRHEFKTVFTFESTEWSYGWLLGTDPLGIATLGF